MAIFFGSAFRTKSKGHDAVMKRVIKRTSSGYKGYIQEQEHRGCVSKVDWSAVYR
jgi:hypothetical protein